MGRVPKRQAMRAWPRPQINVDREPILQFNYQAYFLKRVECLVPAVTNSLVSGILPHYRSAFRAESDRLEQWESLAFDKKVRHHPDMAEALFDKAPTHRWEGYEEVSELLKAWMDDHSLKASWVAREALNALLHWTRNEPAYEFDAPILANGNPDCRRVTDLSYEWPIKPIFPQDLKLPPPEKRVFELPAYPQSFDYSGWDHVDIDDHRKEIHRRFDLFRSGLDAEFENVLAKLNRIGPVKPFTRPERFDMLALYQCKNYPTSQISKEFGKESSTVLRDLRACSVLIALPLKQVRGRRR